MLANLPYVDRPQLLRFFPARPELPLAVLVPGMDGTGWLLYSQARKLFGTFDPCCLALPVDDDRCHWDDLAAILLRLIEAELGSDPRRPVYAIGESFGACLTLKLAARQLPGLWRIIVCNSAAAARDWLPLTLGSTVTQLVPDFLHPWSSLAIAPLLFSLDRIDPSDRALIFKALQAPTRQAARWRLRLLEDFALSTQEWNAIRCPVLGIASEGDRLLPSVTQTQSLVDRLPDATLYRLPSSGHACLIEASVDLKVILQEQGWLPQDLASSLPRHRQDP